MIRLRGLQRIPTGDGLSPRVRGNRSHGTSCSRQSQRGLSPRVRGNPVSWLILPSPERWTGSIPAGAGEPRPRAAGLEVYPRGCGGTSLLGSQMHPISPVYPRGCGGTSTIVAFKVRGNPYLSSILRSRVYPRGCGGTSALGQPIPAGAAMKRRVRTVYPRGCGGTMLPTIGSGGFWSIALCGSIPAGAGEPGQIGQYASRRHVVPLGSIPAGAGEPVVYSCGVFPGVGGTPPCLAPGLSPRVRGNLPR